MKKADVRVTPVVPPKQPAAVPVTPAPPVVPPKQPAAVPLTPAPSVTTPKQPPAVLQPANKILANDLGSPARSKSTPSVGSARSTISGGGQNPQAIQRSKSQAPQKVGSGTGKSPVGYSYSAGPGFRSRRPMGHEGMWQGELPSHFAPGEIKRLGKRFRKLDMDNSGALSAEEFMSLPELQQNPCVQRVLEIFDADGNGEIDFKEFIHGISQFSVKGDKESKLRFAFRLYDMDKDGYISNGELFQVLKMMVGNNLKDGKLQQIVDKTILYADKDGDGKISFQEFCAVVGSSDVHKKMIVQV